MTFRLLIAGGSGQVGRALQSARPPQWEVSTRDSSTVDIRLWHQVRDWIGSVRPNLIVHAAAMTDVDGCESRSHEAFQTNALGARNIARAAASVNANLVYISTNFVFDGEKDEPYHEFDEPSPISVYGASKLAGENETRQSHPDAYIVRTAMVYDKSGRNFVSTMKRLMSERETISVVDDQHGNPTYAPDLARGILELIQTHSPGTYHLTNSGATSWFGWASAIREVLDLDCDVQPTTAADYQRAATPPRNGVMISLAATDLQSTMAGWQDALARCLA